MAEWSERKKILEKCFKTVKLQKPSQRILNQYLTLLAKTAEHPDAVRYNLCIQCDNDHNGYIGGLFKTAFVSLGVEDNQIKTCEMQNLFKNNSPSIYQNYRFVIIVQCFDYSAHAVIDGKIVSEKEFLSFWRQVAAYSEGNPECRIVVIGDESFSEFIKRYDDLKFRFITGFIAVAPVTQEDITKTFCDEIAKYDIPIDSYFNEAAAEYISTVYEKADLKGNAFIRDLVNRVLIRFYSNENSTILSEQHLPFYKRKLKIDDALNPLKETPGAGPAVKLVKNLYSINKGEFKNYRLLFFGPTGAGKSAAARLITETMYSAGMIKKNKQVIITAPEFQSLLLPQMDEKIRQLVQPVRGGFFILDGITISNLPPNAKLQAAQVFNILLGEDVSILIAISGKEKTELFNLLSTLQNKFAEGTAEFRNMSDKELVTVANNILAKEDITLSDDARELIRDRIMIARTKPGFANVRTVRHICRQIIGTVHETPAVVEEKDIRHLMPVSIRRDLQDMIGMQAIKDQLSLFESRMQYLTYLKEHDVSVPAPLLHMLFTGNPGTGKTTVGQQIADCLFSTGMLHTNKLVICSRADLVGTAIGTTAVKTREVIQSALDGVLFIDEAYALYSSSPNDFGHEAITTLVAAMTQYKTRLVVIFAGYENKMQAFVESNAGIRSRIGFTFRFPDYTADELTQMFITKLTNVGFTIDHGVENQVCSLMEEARGIKDFGNGRFVDKCIDMTISMRALRKYDEESYLTITVDDIPKLTDLLPG